MKMKVQIAAGAMMICLMGCRRCEPPEYKIYHCMSFQSPSERNTNLKVIVYQNHEDEELPERIEEFFVNMNGYPTILLIELYYDGDSEAYKVVRFEY